jgi:ribosome-interacting GTPase 1
MSCELDLGVQEVVERIWKELRLMRLYTKRWVANLYFTNFENITFLIHLQKGS